MRAFRIYSKIFALFSMLSFKYYDLFMLQQTEAHGKTEKCERETEEKGQQFLIVAHLYCCIYRPSTRIPLWHSVLKCSNLDLMQLFVVFVDNIYGDGNKP